MAIDSIRSLSLVRLFDEDNLEENYRRKKVRSFVEPVNVALLQCETLLNDAGEERVARDSE